MRPARKSLRTREDLIHVVHFMVFPVILATGKTEAKERIPVKEEKVLIKERIVRAEPDKNAIGSNAQAAIMIHTRTVGMTVTMSGMILYLTGIPLVAVLHV